MSKHRLGRQAAASVALLLLAAGCGGDDGEKASTPAPAPTTAAAAAQPVQCATTDISSAANKPEYTLTAALTIEGPTSLKAGANGITVKVSGGQHEFKILKGNVVSQPRKANQAIDEAKLTAGALLFKANPSAAGQSCTGLVTLPAGAYTFVCNVEAGGNSHAGRGQIIDVTVA